MVARYSTTHVYTAPWLSLHNCAFACMQLVTKMCQQCIHKVQAKRVKDTWTGSNSTHYLYAACVFPITIQTTFVHYGCSSNKDGSTTVAHQTHRWDCCSKVIFNKVHSLLILLLIKGEPTTTDQGQTQASPDITDTLHNSIGKNPQTRLQKRHCWYKASNYGSA